jgi:hypothetical protein
MHLHSVAGFDKLSRRVAKRTYKALKSSTYTCTYTLLRASTSSADGLRSGLTKHLNLPPKHALTLCCGLRQAQPTGCELRVAKWTYKPLKTSTSTSTLLRVTSCESRFTTIIICDNVIREGKVLEENHPDEKVRGVQQFYAFLSTYTTIRAILFPTKGVK